MKPEPQGDDSQIICVHQLKITKSFSTDQKWKHEEKCGCSYKINKKYIWLENVLLSLLSPSFLLASGGPPLVHRITRNPWSKHKFFWIISISKTDHGERDQDSRKTWQRWFTHFCRGELLRFLCRELLGFETTGRVWCFEPVFIVENPRPLRLLSCPERSRAQSCEGWTLSKRRRSLLLRC